jgi:8-hydroxy-5-deazaflavin:NADPH oxidoreductase
MRIAIIGTGKIGGTLGTALARAGHQVTFGSRHPDQVPPREDGTTTAPVGAALEPADAVLLAIPAAAVEDFLAEHGAALDGKLVVDATNRMGAPVANAGELIAAAAPGARYARAFNSLGWENFADPVFDGEPADLFFASAEEDRAQVEELIAGVGLRPAYLGAGQQAAVDAVLPVWFALTRARGNRRVALRVLEK